MKGDFSRLSFRPSDHYRRVLLQQGRLLLDADWREQVAIDVHRDETTTADVVGRAAVPIDGDGFRIGAAVNLEAVDLTDQAHGWAVGGGASLLTTADGGATWSRQPLPATISGTLHAVHFPTDQHGCIVGAGASIATTTDGGATWTPRTATVPAGTDLQAVRFADADHGVAVGGNRTVLTTTDGGATWTAVALAGTVPDDLRGVDRPSVNRGCAVGAAATILVTTDGGTSWTPKPAPAGVTADLNGVSFVSETIGWAVGAGGTILQTTDGGDSWQPQSAPSGVTATLRSVRFVDQNLGLAVGDDATILATADGGTTWERRAAPTGLGSSLLGVDLADASHGWAVGADLVVVATTDGGAIWAPQVPPFDLPGGTGLLISPGRMYVDGILCENERTVPVTAQPDQPELDLGLLAAGRWLAYADVWERHLTAAERPQLREVALAGPDTATRTKTVWQVKLHPATATDVCGSFDGDWTPEAAPSTGRLRARATPVPPPASVCQVPPTGGFRRLENQLYRVEILQAGVRGAAGTPGVARFAWSRENGSVTAGLEAITTLAGATESTLTLSQAGRDEVLGFAADQRLELIDERRAREGEAGVLVRIKSVSGTLLKVGEWPGDTPLTMADFPEQPIVRRWEATSEVTPGWIELEDGVEVQFAAGQYSVGDFWTIPARTLTANVEWEHDGAGPIFEPREGVQHHCAPLALLQSGADGTWAVQSDCRKLFPALTELRHYFMVGGSGQEEMPDPGGALVPLDHPLEVGVDNGRFPVAGATVRFTITAGSGQLNGGGSPLKVTTGTDGIARCSWSIDSTTQLQHVEAALLDDQDQVVDVPVHFLANLSRASEVAYDPGACPSLAGDGTVQRAVDKLAHLTDLVKLNGDGQIVAPGQPLDPVVVRAVNDCGAAITDGTVNFHVEAGGGTLPNGSDDEDVQIAGGVATIQWTLGGAATGTQVLRATLVQAAADGTPLPVRSPAPEVRFTANLAQAEGPEPGIHVTAVQHGSDDLKNDAIVKAADLADGGLRVICDQHINPNSVVGKPTCFVTVELPYPLVPPDISFWKNSPVIGFQPLILDGQVDLETPQTIRWRPTDATRNWLANLLMDAVQPRNVRRVLVRLTLKGNDIWSADGRLYLDGEAFADTASTTQTDWRPPSGDGRRGGDFEFWFWIIQ